jgi:hypothetical protein
MRKGSARLLIFLEGVVEALSSGDISSPSADRKQLRNSYTSRNPFT